MTTSANFEDNTNSQLGQVFSSEFPQLLQTHLQHLLASAISLDVIKERGYRSVLGKKELQELGFSRVQCRTPAILMPSWGVSAKIVGHQLRPDFPRSTSKGKLIKYETPQATTNHIDCPPTCREKLIDPTVPLWVTEGVKKSDALASYEQCVIDFPGVWSWKGKNPFGGTTILADFDYIAFNDRKVYLAFDSDVATNKSVKQALARLATHLSRRGAKVSIICLPQQGAEKVGVDDFLAQGHNIQELTGLGALWEKEEKEEGVRKILTPYFVYNGELYLEVRKNDGHFAFAYLNEGKVSFTPEISLSDSVIFPRPLPVKEGRTINFCAMPDENIQQVQLLNPRGLYEKVMAHIRRYIDLPQLDLELCIYYIIFTWFYIKATTLGYLRFLADTGKGKSRIQKVVGDLCFFPIYASGASSFSGMARQADKWRGTLIVDESDTSGEKGQQFMKYLNLGFERYKYYVLSDKQNPKYQEFFDPFCPKILAMRDYFQDNATEGRLLSISPHETVNLNIPIIPPPEYYREAQQLRNELALFTLQYWNKVDGTKMLPFNDLRVEPRLKQLAMPLSIVFQIWPEGVGDFKLYLVKRQRQIKKARSLSWDGALVNLVYAIAVGDTDLQEDFADYYKPQGEGIQAITPSMVARQMKTSTKNSTQSLNSVGFEVEKRWIVFGKDDKQKKKQVRAYAVPNERVWSEIMQRYFYDEDVDEIPEIPEVLKSAKFMCLEVSQVSQVSQKNGLEINKDKSVTDETDETLPDTQQIENKVKPTKPCYACGSADWRQRQDGEWVCTKCHPSSDYYTSATAKALLSQTEDSLGMSIEQALGIWHKEGAPVIHLAPQQNCFDLEGLLETPHINDTHLQTIKKWLQKHKQEDNLDIDFLNEYG